MIWPARLAAGVIDAKFASSPEKTTTGITLPLLSRSSGSRSGLAPLASATSSTARSKSLVFSARFASSIELTVTTSPISPRARATTIVFVDMKDARTSARLVRDGFGERAQQTVEVDWLAQPVKDIELGRPQVVTPAAGIGGYNDDRRVVILRQRAKPHDKTYAITIRQVDIHQNCMILSSCRARQRVAYRIGKIGGKPDLP